MALKNYARLEAKARRRFKDPELAKELTQEFIKRVLEKPSKATDVNLAYLLNKFDWFLKDVPKKVLGVYESGEVQNYTYLDDSSLLLTQLISAREKEMPFQYRSKQVLNLLLKDYTLTEIKQELNISYKAVEMASYKIRKSLKAFSERPKGFATNNR